MIQKENSVKVWDSFVRLFHLLIILLVAGLWWTADNGRMDLHKDFGIAILSLLVMRVAWGIFGSDNARFKTFVRSPLQIPSHLKKLFNGQYQSETTHSTAGGWAVIVMLALLIAQAMTGLFSSDGILFSGPLASWVSSDAQELLTDWHKTQFDEANRCHGSRIQKDHTTGAAIKAWMARFATGDSCVAAFYVTALN